MSTALDTNILIYAVDPDPAVRHKREIASHLLKRDDCVLPIQALNEFVAQASSARRPYPIRREDALTTAVAFRRHRIVALDIAIFDLAVDILARAKFSWWDCLIVAAAISAGCDTLLTEDMQHGRVIDGLRIENPFRELA